MPVGDLMKHAMSVIARKMQGFRHLRRMAGAVQRWELS
jgi:hypothetical protein